MKIKNDEIIIAAVKIIVIILVTMWKHNHTNNINNDNFSLTFALPSCFK